MKSLFACPSDLEICCGCNVIDLISFKWVSLSKELIFIL